MEFTCHKNDLLKGVATVERAVSKRDSMAVLTGIYVQAENDRLRFVATNLEMSIECYVPAQVQQPGTTVLEARVLSQLVRKLAGEQVSCRLNSNQTAQIKAGRSKFSVHTLDPEEFPVLPDVEEHLTYSVPRDLFHRMVRHTAFAAATDESRPFLTGVLMEISDDGMTCVATDSSRLSYFKGAVEQKLEGSMTGIIPVSSLNELTRIVDGNESDTVELNIGTSQAVFSLPNVRMITRVIEGQFPDYRRVFPEGNESKFVVDRLELLAAVERVSLIAHRNAPIVRLKVQEGTLSLASHEAEVGEAFEELSVDQKGNDEETAYQARYLLDVLRAMDGENVKISLGEGLKQGSIRSVENDEFIYIVMPVRVG